MGIRIDVSHSEERNNVRYHCVIVIPKTLNGNDNPEFFGRFAILLKYFENRKFKSF